MEGDYDQGPWLGAAFVSNGIKVGLSDIGLEYPPKSVEPRTGDTPVDWQM
jgi:hypothetical protein